MKIAFLDAHNQAYDKIAEMLFNNRQTYCKRHGYDFLCYKFGELDRTAHWGRVLGIKQYIRNYDWLFYLDTDAIIMNPAIKIDKFIDEKYNLIIGPEAYDYHISTSGMLIKNCDWTYKLLEEWYRLVQFIDKPYKPDPSQDHGAVEQEGGMFFEQSAMHYLYDTRKDYRDKIKTIPRRCFNAIITRRADYYKEGDFILHFPGESYETKFNMVSKFLKQSHDTIRFL